MKYIAVFSIVLLVFTACHKKRLSTDDRLLYYLAGYDHGHYVNDAKMDREIARLGLKTAFSRISASVFDYTWNSYMSNAMSLKEDLND